MKTNSVLTGFMADIGETDEQAAKALLCQLCNYHEWQPPHAENCKNCTAGSRFTSESN